MARHRGLQLSCAALATLVFTVASGASAAPTVATPTVKAVFNVPQNAKPLFLRALGSRTILAYAEGGSNATRAFAFDGRGGSSQILTTMEKSRATCASCFPEPVVMTTWMSFLTGDFEGDTRTGVSVYATNGTKDGTGAVPMLPSSYSFAIGDRLFNVSTLVRAFSIGGTVTSYPLPVVGKSLTYVPCGTTLYALEDRVAANDTYHAVWRLSGATWSEVFPGRRAVRRGRETSRCVDGELYAFTYTAGPTQMVPASLIGIPVTLSRVPAGGGAPVNLAGTVFQSGVSGHAGAQLVGFRTGSLGAASPTGVVSVSTSTETELGTLPAGIDTAAGPVWTKSVGPYFYFAFPASGVWRTDGTAAGTIRLTDRAAASSDVGVIGASTVMFSTLDESDAPGTATWSYTDGTVAGTRTLVLKDWPDVPSNAYGPALRPVFESSRMWTLRPIAGTGGAPTQYALVVVEFDPRAGAPEGNGQGDDAPYPNSNDGDESPSSGETPPEDDAQGQPNGEASAHAGGCAIGHATNLSDEAGSALLGGLVLMFVRARRRRIDHASVASL